MFKKITSWLGRQSPWVLLAVGVVGALVIGGGATAGMAWTNTEAFCTGCHEMRDNVYAEFKESPHDRNASGVRAKCPDCHVPRETVDLLIRKVQASGELWAKLTGKIDTREQFEEHRYQLAVNVWKRMKTTDSRECRHCHTQAAMVPDLQSERAQTRHAKAEREGMTCIDCHFGIAHQEPEGPGPQEIDFTKL
ncbi:MAG: NapC/NirT family cytochrome c [Aromatoleum sp.]|jgi:cytochrome c-type protein NapC|uniref:NapC/NirT family cytochrome c n=1 Tax=Aromatoleum sp. TaxID=2307007 RepID=UPI0028945AF3|nr:NapC/NirT family cytochrome c [Aromatoleum sp.]MDT3672451.1 NapC/NirT family cytochrome c [Aromatoleum sp.]